MAVRPKVLLAASALLLLGGVSACQGEAPPPDDQTSTTSSPAPGTSSDEPSSDEASDSPSDATSEPAPAGCSPTDDTVPPEAASVTTDDLDGDGEADEIWLADVDGSRLLGVSTASGAVFSTEFSSGAPQAATAYAGVLGDGSAVVLLDTGRAVPLYAVIDCSLEPTMNEQGEQYTFDKGFTGYGTGVGCEETDDGGLGLVGYLADVVDDSATVTSTPITLGDQGATATNGEPDDQSGLDPDDPLVEAASSVTCGDSEPVQEPQS